MALQSSGLIFYCACIISVATALLLVATVFTVHNYRVLRRLGSLPASPARRRRSESAVPVVTGEERISRSSRSTSSVVAATSRRTGMATYDDIAETETTGRVVAYSPAQEPAPPRSAPPEGAP